MISDGPARPELVSIFLFAVLYSIFRPIGPTNTIFVWLQFLTARKARLGGSLCPIFYLFLGLYSLFILKPFPVMISDGPKGPAGQELLSIFFFICGTLFYIQAYIGPTNTIFVWLQFLMAQKVRLGVSFCQIFLFAVLGLYLYSYYFLLRFLAARKARPCGSVCAIFNLQYHILYLCLYYYIFCY